MHLAGIPASLEPTNASRTYIVASQHAVLPSLPLGAMAVP